MDSDSAEPDPLAPQSQKDTEFLPSRVDLAENCDEEAMHELATSSLVPVKQEWDPEGETSDRFLHRCRGLCSDDLPARLEAMEKASTALAERLEFNDEKLAELQLHLRSLDERVSSMAASWYSYHSARERFLSTFKKDKLGRATEDDLRIIAEGNFIPEGGDAATDALLYEGTMARKDFTTFEGLYGLHPAIVRNISE